MAEISNAEAALMGLLAEEPRYPYQIEQEVKYRDMRFWTGLSMSSIYKLLRKLESEGLVNCAAEVSPENRLRKLYSLSETGKKALTQKIEKLLSRSEHTRWPVDIGIYNSHLLPPRKARAALEKYRQTLAERIKCYEELLKFLQSIGCPPHRQAIAVRPVYLLKAEAEWVGAFLKQTEIK